MLLLLTRGLALLVGPQTYRAVLRTSVSASIHEAAHSEICLHARPYTEPPPCSNKTVAVTTSGESMVNAALTTQLFCDKFKASRLPACPAACRPGVPLLERCLNGRWCYADRGMRAAHATACT